MEIDVKKLVDGYKKFNGKYVKVQNNPDDPSTTIFKRKLKEPNCIDKLRSLVRQIM